MAAIPVAVRRAVDAPRQPFVPRTDDGSLHSFVEQNRHTNPPERAPGDLRLEPGSRTSRTYRLHGYWSKKPHEVVSACIAAYSRPGDLVLDPFCGSGGTLLMANIAGRVGIGIDRSPAAAFISRVSLALSDGDAIRRLFTALLDRVGPRIESLYATRCHRCGGPADTGFTVISDCYRCPDCGHHFLAENAIRDGRQKQCPSCRNHLPRPRPREGEEVVEMAGRCRGSCRPSRFRRRHDDPDPPARAAFHEFDLAGLERAAATPIRGRFPTATFPPGMKTAELLGRGITSVDQLFTPRNLRALAALRSGIDRYTGADHETLLFILTAGLMSLSLKAQHLEGGGGYLPSMYYVPPVRKERNPIGSLPRIVGNIARGANALHEARQSPADAWAGIGDATDLKAIPDESIDFAFMDPPYSDKIQFSELNLVWEAWLGFSEHWGDDELVLNRARGKSAAAWAIKIERLAVEARRVLKPGAHAVMTYTDSHRGTYELLLAALQAAGFDLVDGSARIEMSQNTYVQRTSRGAEQRHPLLVLKRH
ncbi:MAG: DNA methyltransferase [Chloroflexota bacterium]|jgi:DNA modification methylase|nr:DNA methyltransferase [Chloroflexota bacterium]MDP6756620.1 DNA methyltransferase [Chloroflexota bacterium]